MPDTATEEVTTASVLQDMLTENTGRHFLDSGDAYGRSWQRNQGRVFADEPPVTLSWKWGGVTLSVFHFLNDRLDYQREADAAWLAWGEANDDPWLVNAEQWVEILDGTGIYGDGKPNVVNTYNGEDALSQTIQYVYFTLERETALPLPGQTHCPEPIPVCCYCGVTVQPGLNGIGQEGPDGSTACSGTGSGGEHDYEQDDNYEEGVVLLAGGTYVLLQIHGGADVRGGYTKPRLFSISAYDETAIFDNARASLYCQNNECRGTHGQGTYWDTDNAGYSWHNDDGADLGDYDKVEVDFTDGDLVEPGVADPAARVGRLIIDTDEDVAYCPVCGEGVLHAGAYPAG